MAKNKDLRNIGMSYHFKGNLMQIYDECIKNTSKIHILTVNHPIGIALAQKKNPKWLKVAKNPLFSPFSEEKNSMNPSKTLEILRLIELSQKSHKWYTFSDLGYFQDKKDKTGQKQPKILICSRFFKLKAL